MIKRILVLGILASSLAFADGGSCTSFANQLLKAERLGDVEKPGPNVKPPSDDHYYRLMDRTTPADPIRYFQVEARAGRIYRGQRGIAAGDWTVDVRSSEKGNPVLKTFLFKRQDGKCLLQKLGTADWSFDVAACQAFQAEVPKVKEALKPPKRTKKGETPEPAYTVTDRDRAALDLCVPQYMQYFGAISTPTPTPATTAKSVE